MKVMPFETSLAQPSDADDIALAHRDSIRSIGPRFYPPTVVTDWQEGLTASVYLYAMERGEVFFIAKGMQDGTPAVLGFASDYAIDDSTHGISVYVTGTAARCGIGSALLKAAEAHALDTGASSIAIEASFAGVEFYRVNGFTVVGRGETHLRSGRPIGCVFMRKSLG